MGYRWCLSISSCRRRNVEPSQPQRNHLQALATSRASWLRSNSLQAHGLTLGLDLDHIYSATVFYSPQPTDHTTHGTRAKNVNGLVEETFECSIVRDTL